MTTTIKKIVEVTIGSPLQKIEKGGASVLLKGGNYEVQDDEISKYMGLYNSYTRPKPATISVKVIAVGSTEVLVEYKRSVVPYGPMVKHEKIVMADSLLSAQDWGEFNMEVNNNLQKKKEEESAARQRKAGQERGEKIANLK